MSFRIVPLSGALGAEVRGVDAAALDGAGMAEVRAALLRYGVICFRGQDLSPEHYLAFARAWGDVHLHPYLRGLDDHPEIIEIVREADDPTGFADHWHTDQIFTPEPANFTMLLARETPEAGGDTMFASLTGAYETLSEGMQRMAARLRTCNFYDKKAPRSTTMAARIPDRETRTEETVHPLVRIHPETGRPALYVSDARSTRRFDGMSEEESRPLLAWLMRHATRPELTCRIRWEPGTLGIWDNRSVLHMAVNDYYGKRRVMHRITIRGEPVRGPLELGH